LTRFDYMFSGLFVFKQGSTQAFPCRRHASGCPQEQLILLSSHSGKPSLLDVRKPSVPTTLSTFSLTKTSDTAENPKFHSFFETKAKHSIEVRGRLGNCDTAMGSTYPSRAPASGNGSKIFPEILDPNQITDFQRSPPWIIILTVYLRFDLEYAWLRHM
jgi:hypothetical protein